MDTPDKVVLRKEHPDARHARDVAEWCQRSLEQAKAGGDFDTRCMVQNAALIVAALRAYSGSPPLSSFEVWMEGVDGNSPAFLVGVVCAPSWHQACKIAMSHAPYSVGKYDDEAMTWDGIGLFSDEAAARKRYG